MRRFDLVMPKSVEECLRALAERGPGRELVAGGTDLLPQTQERHAPGRLRGRPVRGEPAPAARPRQRRRPADRRGGRRRARSSGTPACRPPIRPLPRAARWSDRPGPEPGHARRQPLQRRAVGRHGAAAPGPGRRGGDRGARRAPAACRSRRSSSGSAAPCSRPDELLVEIVVPAPGPHSGGELPAPHAPAGAGHRRRRGGVAAHALEGVCAKARDRPCRGGADAGPRHGGGAGASRASPSRRRLIERAAGAAVEAARPISDQRGLRRLPPAPGPGPDPPHAHHGPRARGRLTIPGGAATCRSRS